MSLISAIGGALSGAIGATERFSNSANNVANQRSIAAPNAPLLTNTPTYVGDPILAIACWIRRTA